MFFQAIMKIINS